MEDSEDWMYNDEDDDYEEFIELMELDKPLKVLKKLQENSDLLYDSIHADDDRVLDWMLTQYNSIVDEIHGNDFAQKKLEPDTLTFEFLSAIRKTESEDGLVPISIAAQRGHLNWCRFLMHFYKGNVCKHPAMQESNRPQCDDHRTPLHYSVIDQDDEQVVELILSNELLGSIDSFDIDQRTPLHYAALFGNISVLNVLIDHIEDSGDDNMESKRNKLIAYLKSQDIYGLTPLHLSVFSNDASSVELLFSKVRDVSPGMESGIISDLIRTTLDTNGRNLLHTASYCQNITILDLLLRNGADITSVDHDRLSVVHWAVIGYPFDVAPPGTTSAKAFMAELKTKAGLDFTRKDSKNRTALHFASFYGHYQVCEELINLGLSVMDVDRQGWNALHYAAASGSRCVLVLLNCGRDANPATTKNRKRMTPLHVAACKGKSSSFQAMLDFVKNEHLRCYLNVIDYRKRTYLFYLLENDMVECIKMLLQHSSSLSDLGINICDTNGMNILHGAAARGAIEGAQLLFDEVEISTVENLVTATDKRGRNVLHHAATHGQDRFIRWILEEGYEGLLNETDRDGNLPIHYALAHGHMSCFLELVGDCEMSSMMDSFMRCTNSKQTALHAGVVCGDEILVEYLLDIARNTDRLEEFLAAKDEQGFSALLSATSLGHLGVVNALIYAGSNVHDTDNQGHGLFHCASMNKSEQIIKHLLQTDENGKLLTDISILSKNHQSPLHIAAYFGNQVSLEYLLACELLDVNQMDIEGRTALHLATLMGQRECVEVLLKSSDCDVLLPDKYGRSAIDSAAFKGDLAIALLLLDAAQSRSKGDFDPSTLLDNNGRTPLHAAAYAGHPEMCTLLIENYNFPVDAVDKHRRAAIHRAARHPNSTDILEVLLEAGANVNLQDENGMTAAMIAAFYANDEILEVLMESGIEEQLKDKKGRTFEDFLQDASEEDEEPDGDE